MVARQGTVPNWTFLHPLGPLSLNHCINKLDLPASEHFRFRQISHFLCSIWADKPLSPRFYELWCGQGMEQREGILTIYSSLVLPASKSPFMTSFKGVLNTSLTHASLKVISRWYYTPFRLASMYPSADPLCFRGCQLSGTMAHIWWECPEYTLFGEKSSMLLTSSLVTRSPEPRWWPSSMPQSQRSRLPLKG